MQTLALYSNKGGTGKTAAAVNLSFLAAQAGFKTLVCDLDAQGSATYYFRVKPELKRAARGLTRGGKPIDRSIKGTDYENLDLLPADLSHRKLDLIFNKLKRSKRRLNKVVDSLADEYDLIILDCPPSLNLLSENIFKAADFILVPLIPTTLSERAHHQLVSFFASKNYDPVKIYAFLSMVDRRKKLHRDLAQSLQTEFNGMLQSVIPYASEVEQMGLHREPVVCFAPYSKAALSYRQLWAEIDRHLLRDGAIAS